MDILTKKSRGREEKKVSVSMIFVGNINQSVESLIKTPHLTNKSIQIIRGDIKMSDYNLYPNEAILLKSENVFKGMRKGDLVLTNLAILWAEKNFLGKIKNVNRIPFNQVKMYNGNPQVCLGKAVNGTPQLEIYIVNGQEKFSFNNTLLVKREIGKWINEITKAITGYVPDKSFSAIPGTEFVADTLKGTVGTLADSLGVKKTVSTKCMACRAPITGKKGETVRCKYCDTQQTL